ncbi:hypothetical protein [Mycetohabitans rhizoxinica]|uniref:hypothetical protein n=1 Tax=Mycetohabitans rhizoxinica TaxID=412963 RepID=UPI003BB18E51
MASMRAFYLAWRAVEISRQCLESRPLPKTSRYCLDDATPPAGKAFKQRAYDLLPRVKITDLLREVD